MNSIYSEQRLFTLQDGQIAVRRQKMSTSDLAIATHIQGGQCNNQTQCENDGGTWDPNGTGNRCDNSNSNCVDSGSGDWDA